MKKLYTPILLLVAALVGGLVSQYASTSVATAQVSYSPQRGETLRGTVDPTAGAGVRAIEGTLYVRTGATDALYQKTGPTDAAWTQIALNGGAASFTTVVATGNITSSGGNLVATVGDVTAGDDVIATGDVTATGNVQGVIVRGTTALEYPSNNLAPAVRASDDTDSGFSSSANTTVMWSGGFSWWLTNVGSAQTSNTATVVTTGQVIRTPRTVDIDAVGDTVATSGSSAVIVTLSAGNITPTSTPFIADGTSGQEIAIINGDAADILTLTDEGGMAGSNLQLGAATRALGPGDVLVLRYTSVPTTDWYEVAFTNN
jgi:hypothetical protein